MPELPEVETVRRDLARVLTGARVASLRVLRTKLLRNPRRSFTRSLVGATITRVGRRGKQLALYLSSGYVLIVHLKMTGQLVWRSRRGLLRGGGHPIAGTTGAPNRYTYVIFGLSGGGQLYFNDVRQFGYLRLVPQPRLAQVWSALGPEPLSSACTAAALRAALARRGRSAVKAALLDQRVVAGLGNIYADESLFVARLRPTRRAGSLRPREVRALRRAIRQVLRRSLAARGTSFRSFRDGQGGQGAYWAERLVYGRAGEPCPRCHLSLRRTVVAGRGTVFCPACQR